MNKATKEQKFTAAYDQYLNVIFLFFYAKIDNRDQAKDLAQDTFIKTWRYVEEGNEVANMRALLYKIANNTLVDWYRKHKNQSLDVMIEGGFDPVDENTAADKQSEVQNVIGHLGKLSDMDQQLIVWRFIEGRTSKQISEDLQERANTVSVMVHRAVGRLRKLAVG